MAKLFIVFVTLSAFSAFAWALPPLLEVGEGTCANLQFHPVEVNADFANNLNFFTSGSKFSMYLFASVLPNYNQIREDEFPDKACYKKLTINNQAAISGFGRHLCTWQASQNGTFTDFLQTDPIYGEYLTKCVTSLTDGHSFVFNSCCLNPLDEKEWIVKSKTGHLDQKAINLIEAHAISLGFDWTKAVFLNYDRCHMGWGQ